MTMRWVVQALLGVAWLCGCGDARSEDADEKLDLGRCYAALVSTCVEYPIAKYPDGHWTCDTYGYEHVATCPAGALAKCTDAEGVTAYYYTEAIANAVAASCAEQVRLDE
jgi:hypothetical protein